MVGPDGVPLAQTDRLDAPVKAGWRVIGWCSCEIIIPTERPLDYPSPSACTPAWTPLVNKPNGCRGAKRNGRWRSSSTN
ncbi:MAG: hypothetical protein H6656_07325 [Ardenticatenaceae bacterium]|nr:hypothetical protein [Ardenticatenaceae bacterium]